MSPKSRSLVRMIWLCECAYFIISWSDADLRPMSLTSVAS